MKRTKPIFLRALLACITAAILLTVLAPPRAGAADVFLDGCTACHSASSIHDLGTNTTTSDWTDTGIWSGGVLPNLNNDVYLYLNHTANLTVNYDDLSGTALYSLTLDSAGTGMLTLSMAPGGGDLTAGLEYIGYDGTATFDQSAGTNNVTYLYLGYTGTSTGIYNLSGTGTLSTSSYEYIGFGGTGIFNQSGGTNTAGSIFIGTDVFSTGSYTLSGGDLSAHFEYIGQYATGDYDAITGNLIQAGGTFTQTGGTNTLVYDAAVFQSGTLYLGHKTGSSGTYDLSGPATVTLMARNEYIGYGGTGIFNQSGGTNDISNLLYVDGVGGALSIYNLSGGALTASYEYIGNSGDGTFNQWDGTNTISNDLYIGYLWGRTGIYNQWGGTTHVTNDIYLGYLSSGDPSSGTYNLSGGILNVDGNIIANEGYTYLNIDGGTLNLAGSIVDGSGSSSINIDGGTLNVTGDIDVNTFRVGYNPGTTGSHTLGAGQSLSAMDEYIGYEGTGAFYQTGGANDVSFFLFLGYLPTGDGTYDLSGPATVTLSTYREYIGYGGYGTFTQSGGTNTLVDELVLGDRYLDPGGGGYTYGNGTYDLSGTGVLSAPYEYIGDWGTGTFNQTGGTNTVANDLYIAANAGSTGTYTLSGGDLDVVGDIIGGRGLGGSSTLNIDGGTLTVGGTIGVETFRVGYNPGTTGSHNLGAGQSLTADWEYIGLGGDGTFTQSGGTNLITYYLSVGDQYWDGSAWIYGSGTYNLSGPATVTLSALREYIGNGTFNQTGGTNALTGDLHLGWSTAGAGTYNLSGGALNVGGDILDGIGTSYLNIDGGTLTVGGFIDVDVFSVGNASGSTGSHKLSAGQNLTADDEYIGYDGTGTFKQSGGTNTVTNDLHLGWNPTGDGTYDLSGGTLNVGGSILNGTGTGTFNIDGGTLNASAMDVDALYVGSSSGSTGSHTISAGEIVLAVNENIGYLGTGTVNQTGGNNTAANGIILGSAPSGIGIYNLSGGILEADYETIGASGSGAFTQSGALSLNTVNNTLYVGLNTGGSGIYTLSSGFLTANNEYIGFDGAGAFNQSGGTHNITNALVVAGSAGGQGTYNLMGGMLNAGSIINNDTFNFSDGILNLTPGGSGMFTNNADFNLSGTGTRTVNGDVTNYGTVKVTSTTVNWLGTYTELGTYISDPSDNYFTNLVIGDTGYLVGGLGDSFYIGGDFLNSSTQGASWDTVNAYMGFTGAGAHDFYMADWSLAGNFSWGTMELLDAGSLTLTGALTGDLYVGNLVLSAGSTLNLNGFNLYYSTFANLGGTYTGGTLYDVATVPEPSTLLLLGSGLAGLAFVRRRLRG